MECIPLHQGCCQPGRCRADGLAVLWGLTVKAQCLSTFMPPRHPWLSYRPRVVGIDFSQANKSGAERVAMLQPLHLSQISGKVEIVCPFQFYVMLAVTCQYSAKVTIYNQASKNSYY